MLLLVKLGVGCIGKNAPAPSASIVPIEVARPSALLATLKRQSNVAMKSEEGGHVAMKSEEGGLHAAADERYCLCNSDSPHSRKVHARFIEYSGLGGGDCSERCHHTTSRFICTTEEGAGETKNARANKTSSSSTC